MRVCDAVKVAAPFKPDSATDPSDSSNFARFSEEDIVVGAHNEHEQLFAEFWLAMQRWTNQNTSEPSGEFRNNLDIIRLHTLL